MNKTIEYERTAHQKQLQTNGEFETEIAELNRKI